MRRVACLTPSPAWSAGGCRSAGQTVVIENRGGANGGIGMAALIARPPMARPSW
jgi:tripartite-type tricarboxylate transporter receptor subunit TctC